MTPLTARLRAFFSSGAFLYLLAVCGLLLFSWPLATILESGGPSGQFYGMYAVWGLMVVGAFVWAKLHTGADDQDGEGPSDEQPLTCTWSPEERSPE